MSSDKQRIYEEGQARILEYNQCVDSLSNSISKFMPYFGKQPKSEYSEIEIDGKSIISLEIGYFNHNDHVGFHGYLLPNGRLVQIVHTVDVKYVKNKSTNYKLETHIVGEEYSPAKNIVLHYIDEPPNSSTLGLLYNIEGNIDQMLSKIERGNQPQNAVYRPVSSPANESSEHISVEFDFGSGLDALFMGLPYEIALIVIIDLAICIYNINAGTHNVSSADVHLVFLIIPLTVHIATFILGALGCFDTSGY